MSDLEEYDRRIVEAAEALAATWNDWRIPGTASETLLFAVQAKREAQRLCDWCAVAPSLAVQKVEDPWLKETAYRCAEHRIETTEL